MTSAERSARQAPFPDRVVVLKDADHRFPNATFKCPRCEAYDYSTLFNDAGIEHYHNICYQCIKEERGGRDA